MELDLACLASIRRFCAEVEDRFQRLDGLICNAGVMVPMEEFRKTKDDLEIHIGVNHIGHFLLTNLLLDILKNTPNSR